MKIEGRWLTDDDIGRGVRYVPQHAHGDIDHPDVERGVIASFDSTRVFVRYYSKAGVLQQTAAATKPGDLRWPKM